MRCLGLLPSETRNLASPLFLFLVWGFARGDPTWGLSVSFGFPCSVCFLLGSSPGFGARGFSPPEKVALPAGEKRNLAPRRGACVCGVAEDPATTSFLRQQGHGSSFALCRWSNEAVPQQMSRISSLDANSTVPVHLVLIQSPFGPLGCGAVCASCSFGLTCSSLDRSRVHCEPKLIILETHQLYSRLISCTRKISTLHLEFKCVHPIRGESSGVPIV